MKITRSEKQFIFENVIIALLYWSISYLNYIFFKNMGLLPMPIWPAAAVAIVAAFYRGWKVIPGIAAGTVLANWLALNSSFSFACCIAVMNSLGPLTGAYLMHRQVGRKLHFKSLSDILVCFCAAAILTPLLTAFGGITSKYLLGLMPLSDFLPSLGKWAVAHSLGTVFFSLPVFIYFINHSPVRNTASTASLQNRKIEIIVLQAAFFLAAFFWLTDSLFEFFWMNKDGKSFAVMLFPFFDMHETFMRFFVSLTFIITGFAGYKLALIQRRHYNDARKIALNLSTTLNSIGDGVISTDSAGIITRLNPIAENLTGWSAAEAAGRHMSEVFHIINAETRSTVINPVDIVISTGRITGLGNHTILISRDGKEYHISDSAAPIISPDNTGEIIGVILVFRDVTGELEVQEKLKHSQRMDAIGQLAGGVAHDFNNMLGGILGFAELLQYKFRDDKETLKLVDMIISTAEKAAGLTQKLLSFARKGTIPSSTVDMNHILDDSVELLKRTIDKRISIKLSLQAKDYFVVGDPAQIQNAIINMGINASLAMPGGGTITISSENIFADELYLQTHNLKLNPDNYIKLEIADTGCGINAEILPKIFEPFFTTREHGKGTGLGLAAVYGTVKQHNGDIIVKSVLNQGTTFTVLLPVAEEERFSQTVDRLELEHGSGRILVVDDESIMRITVKSILENMGYEVSTAQDGKAALEIYRKNMNDFKLVIMDMVMPVMNGKDAFREMQRINPEVKVLLASGFARDEDISEMKHAGLAGYISKPYRSVDLSIAIGKALRT